jgi:hypothetical protein
MSLSLKIWDLKVKRRAFISWARLFLCYARCRIVLTLPTRDLCDAATVYREAKNPEACVYAGCAHDIDFSVNQAGGDPLAGIRCVNPLGNMP